jgi:hypothetical protein
MRIIYALGGSIHAPQKKTFAEIDPQILINYVENLNDLKFFFDKESAQKEQILTNLSEKKGATNFCVVLYEIQLDPTTHGYSAKLIKTSLMQDNENPWELIIDHHLDSNSKFLISLNSKLENSINFLLCENNKVSSEKLPAEVYSKILSYYNHLTFFNQQTQDSPVEAKSYFNTYCTIL